MVVDGKILMAKNGDKEFCLLPNMANRHGLIAGGTGSGKTVTLKVLAESLSDIGVPSFLADVKGDLAGMCMPGEDSDDMKKRVKDFGLDKYDFKYHKYPTHFFEIDRKMGLPVRTTISDFGPTLLSHIMGLNQTQEDILNVIFKIADDNGLLLLDFKDFKKMLEFVSENSKDFSSAYGNMSKTSIQSILRATISLEQQGIEQMFGEPELDLNDLIKTDANGKGYINILYSQALILNPNVYSSFMLWLLSDIYEAMPEVGDLDKPKFVIFFDEAHLLFKDATPILLKKVDQMAKLIRSKGVGLYFITQDPCDIPDTILQQLGNKIQHVHRSYTAKDKKNHKAICDSFRENKDLDTSEVLETLGTGEALISFLDEKGAPCVVDKAKVLPPQSKMGTIDDATRDKEIKSSELYTKYANDVDRESAYEILNKKAEEALSTENSSFEASRTGSPMGDIENEAQSSSNMKTSMGNTKQTKPKQSPLEKKINSSIKSVARSTGSTVGREIAKALITSITGSSKSSSASRIAGNVGSALGRNILGTLLKG